MLCIPLLYYGQQRIRNQMKKTKQVKTVRGMHSSKRHPPSLFIELLFSIFVLLKTSKGLLHFHF